MTMEAYMLLKQDQPYTTFPWFVGVVTVSNGRIVHRIFNGPYASEEAARAVMREAEAKT